MRWRWLVLLLLLVGGCVEVEGFDPVGDVAAIAGGWTIDGNPLTDNTGCDALGADRVRVTFMDDRRPVTHSALFFQCRLLRFNTSEGRGAGPVVGAGEWTVRLDAIDSSGNIVTVGVDAAGNREHSETVAPRVDGADAGPTHVITIPDVNFLTATVSAQFLVGGESANEARCLARGIHEVEIVFDDLSVDLVQRGDREPCGLGLVGARVQPAVAHVIRVRAYDISGAMVSEQGPFTETLEAGQDLELDASGAIDL